jgi:hypothetical protein
MAVIYRAVLGRKAREEITVATIFDESWNPFRKSKRRAMAMRK